MPVTTIEKRREERREDRRWLANSPISFRHEAELVHATADAEVDLRLPLWEPMLQDRPREEIPTHSGVLDLAEQRRLTPPNGSNRKGPDMDCR